VALDTTRECPLCAKSRHSALQQRLALFDYLVGGGEQRWRNVNTKRTRGLQIDDEIEGLVPLRTLPV